MSLDLSKCPKNEQGHLLARTKDGLAVRIVATDANFTVSGERFPLVGLVDCGNRSEYIRSWKISGEPYLTGASPEDLENIPQRVKRWVNFLVNNETQAYGDENSAKGMADRRGVNLFLAVAVPVEFEVRG